MMDNNFVEGSILAGVLIPRAGRKEGVCVGTARNILASLIAYLRDKNKDLWVLTDAAPFLEMAVHDKSVLTTLIKQLEGQSAVRLSDRVVDGVGKELAAVVLNIKTQTQAADGLRSKFVKTRATLRMIRALESVEGVGHG